MMTGGTPISGNPHMTQYPWLYTVQVEPRTFVVSEERLEIQFFDAAKPVLMEEMPNNQTFYQVSSI